MNYHELSQPSLPYRNKHNWNEDNSNKAVCTLGNTLLYKSISDNGNMHISSLEKSRFEILNIILSSNASNDIWTSSALLSS